MLERVKDDLGVGWPLSDCPWPMLPIPSEACSGALMWPSWGLIYTPGDAKACPQHSVDLFKDNGHLKRPAPIPNEAD